MKPYIKHLLLCLSVLFSISVNGQALCDKAGISNGWMLNKSKVEIDKVTQACAETKALYFRADFAWSDVQYNGQDDWNWDNIDRIVNSCLEQELEIIAILDYFPPWADVSTDTTFWSDFVYEAGMRYIPQGIINWEMWNEPNITNFWPEPNVQDYVELILKPGANALRRSAAELNTSITIISGGLAPAATDGTNISQLDFVKGIYTYGGRDYFDVLGQHPYCWPLDPTIPDNFNWFLNTEQLYEVMVANGDGDKKIWGTEMGWPTSSEDSRGVSEEIQASFLGAAYHLWDDWEWSGPLIWYAYNDAGTNFEDPEDNFGLVDVDFNPKPALDSFLLITNNCLTSTSTERADVKKEIKLYPNPTFDRLIIEGVPLDATIHIHDLDGRCVQSYHEIKSNFIIDTTELPKGVYCLSVVTEEDNPLVIQFTKL